MIDDDLPIERGIRSRSPINQYYSLNAVNRSYIQVTPDEPIHGHLYSGQRVGGRVPWAVVGVAVLSLGVEPDFVTTKCSPSGLLSALALISPSFSRKTFETIETSAKKDNDAIRIVPL